MKRYLTLALAACALAPASASAWAPADTATIYPGVMMFTDGAQCTANFVYSDGGSTYLGYAAHCAGLGAATDTNGCTAPSLPVGTPVEIDGASRPGTLAYSSWVTMQAAGENPTSETCRYNDFALVQIDPVDVPNVNPSVPGWGGPTGIASLGGLGSDTYTYGNSSLRFGVPFLKPKQGKSVTRTPGGWSTTVYTATPGIPGDSGSGFLNAAGQASGTLSTVAIAPLPGSNGVGDLPKEVAYMQSHGGPAASVVNGTEPFQTNLATAILNAK